MTRALCYGFAFGLVSLALARVARAEDVPKTNRSVEHKVQLGLGVGLFNSEQLTVDGGTGMEPAPGTPPMNEISRLHVGTMESAAITIGYGISRMFMLGADLIAGYAHDDVRSMVSSTTRFAFAPELRCLLFDTPVFAGVAFDIDVTSTKTGGTRLTHNRVGPGIELGAHLFLTQTVSLDPKLKAFFLLGNEVTSESGSSGGIGVHGSLIELVLGFSAWL